MDLGDTIKAKVTSIENYGIWLEASGVTGLLMIPDISYRRVSHPGEYAMPGDLLTVKVIGFNTQKGQFVASRKLLHPEEKSEG